MSVSTRNEFDLNNKITLYGHIRVNSSQTENKIITDFNAIMGNNQINKELLFNKLKSADSFTLSNTRTFGNGLSGFSFALNISLEQVELAIPTGTLRLTCLDRINGSTSLPALLNAIRLVMEKNFLQSESYLTSLIPKGTPLDIALKITEISLLSIPKVFTEKNLYSYISKLFSKFHEVSTMVKLILPLNDNSEKEKALKYFSEALEEIQNAVLIKFKQLQSPTPQNIEEKSEKKTLAIPPSAYFPNINGAFSGKLTDNQANLRIFPTSHGIPMSSQDLIVYGDLHANSIKFIYNLSRDNFIGLSPEDYQELISLFESPNFDIMLTKLKQDFSQFETYRQSVKDEFKRYKELLQKITAVTHDSIPNILKIGDTVGDRSKNDFYTLLFLKRIIELCYFPMILASNHDKDFIRAWEEGVIQNPDSVHWHDAFCPVFIPGQAGSLMNFIKCIQLEVIDKQEASDLVENYYLPLIIGLKLNADYTNNKMSLFTHAPVGLYIIPEIAELLQIPFDKSNHSNHPDKLLPLVDAINIKIKELILNKQFDLTSGSERNQNALWQLMWDQSSRWHDPREKDIIPEDWSIDYIAGHIGIGQDHEFSNPQQMKAVNLDNHFGKDCLKGNDLHVFYIGNNPQFLDLYKKDIEKRYQPSTLTKSPDETKKTTDPDFILSDDENDFDLDGTNSDDEREILTEKLTALTSPEAQERIQILETKLEELHSEEKMLSEQNASNTAASNQKSPTSIIPSLLLNSALWKPEENSTPQTLNPATLTEPQRKSF